MPCLKVFTIEISGREKESNLQLFPNERVPKAHDFCNCPFLENLARLCCTTFALKIVTGLLAVHYQFVS